MLPSKFGVNWPFGSGEEVKNRFSRWQPWRPSWISDRNDFINFWSTSHPNVFYQVSSQLAQGRRRCRLLKQLLTLHDAQRTTDIDWPQQLTMSTSCSGELKIWANLAQWLQRRSRLNNFPIQMLWGSFKCIGKQTWPCRKKVNCQRTTIFLANLVDLLSPMICAQIQPQGILSSREEDF